MTYSSWSAQDGEKPRRVEDLPRAHRPRDALGFIAALALILAMALAGEREARLFLHIASTMLPIALVAGLVAFAAFRVQFGNLRSTR